MASGITLRMFLVLCPFLLRAAMAYKDEADFLKNGCRAHLEKCQQKHHPCCAGLHCVYQRCRWSAYPDDSREYTLLSMQKQQRMLEQLFHNPGARTLNNLTANSLLYLRSEKRDYSSAHYFNGDGQYDRYSGYFNSIGGHNNAKFMQGDYRVSRTSPGDIYAFRQNGNYDPTRYMSGGQANTFPRRDTTPGIDSGKMTNHRGRYPSGSQNRYWLNTSPSYPEVPA
ncbi:hypothetical protein BIW11_11970 [Tropilaelaps mercedesae]|uniref:Uncharacterized protein n=1 Tax=Tropilaelaps mercedesae TaxID=418985 RepID=A0A1V9X8Q9_9ACAR|nr:hypothetical protein BIW11_11970 [Tropilaelaps mercedesae]